MSLLVDSILRFYTPFVSTMMTAKFQRGEMLFPIVVAAFLAIAGSMPLFIAQRWLLGILGVIAWFLALYTLQAAMMYGSAEQRPDGSMYIGPSVASITHMMILFISFAFTLLYFVFLAVWTGLIPGPKT